jgi:hypothetical protein
MISPRALAGLCAVTLASLASLVTAAARADGFVADRFRPAPAGDSFFGVESAASMRATESGEPEQGRLRAAIVLEYARAPIVLRQSDAAGLEVGKVLGYQAFARADVAYAVGERVLAWIDVPFLVAASGDEEAAKLVQIRAPSGASLGDARLGARVHLAGARDGAFQLALSNAIALPTGDRAQFTGDGRVSFEESLVIGGIVDARRGLWSASGGVRLRPDRTLADKRVGNELTFGAAYALTASRRRVTFGIESFGAVGLGAGARGVALEVLLDARVRVAPWFVGVAAGPGLTSAPGTPSYRVVATLGWAGF